MNMCLDEDREDADNDYVSKRKRLAPPDKHIMNKNERRALTRLQQKSGKSEEQLRQDLGVRRVLAAAAKARGPGGSRMKRIMREMRKEAAATLNTHNNDPRVQGLANKLRMDRYDWYGYRRRFW